MISHPEWGALFWKDNYDPCDGPSWVTQNLASFAKIIKIKFKGTFQNSLLGVVFHNIFWLSEHLYTYRIVSDFLSLMRTVKRCIKVRRNKIQQNSAEIKGREGVQKSGKYLVRLTERIEILACNHSQHKRKQQRLDSCSFNRIQLGGHNSSIKCSLFKDHVRSDGRWSIPAYRTCCPLCWCRVYKKCEKGARINQELMPSHLLTIIQMWHLAFLGYTIDTS